MGNHFSHTGLQTNKSTHYYPKPATFYINHKFTEMGKLLDKILNFFSWDRNEDHLKNLAAKMFALKSSYDMLLQGAPNPSLSINDVLPAMQYPKF